MTLTSAEELEFEETEPRRPGRGRRPSTGSGQRIGVVVRGVILAGAVCTIIGLTFVQGSWWYTDGSDRALNGESRARVEAIRDEVDASGDVPVW